MEGLASRAHAEITEGACLAERIKEDLVVRRIAIQICTEIMQWLENDDSTTRRVIKDFPKMEEMYSDNLAGHLEELCDRS